MGKAVLVMDMPESCVDCGLYEYAVSRCNAKDKFQNNISKDFKPSWCPLQPMPEKREPNPLSDSNYFEAMGWNACIDTMGGR